MNLKNIWSTLLCNSHITFANKESSILNVGNRTLTIKNKMICYITRCGSKSKWFHIIKQPTVTCLSMHCHCINKNVTYHIIGMLCEKHTEMKEYKTAAGSSNGSHFTNMDQLYSQHRKVITPITICGIKLVTHSQTFNGTIAEVCKLISDFIPHIFGHVITYPC